MDKRSIIGVDIGAPYVRIGRVCNGHVEKELTLTIDTNAEKDAILKQVASGVAKLINSNVAGIGVGVPSIVDVSMGVVYEVSRIPSWKEVHLKDNFEEKFNLPVYVNNDANCFASGVKYFGIGKKYRNVVGLILGAGMGAGVILDNKLQSGTNCGVGEYGNLPFREKDLEYYCSTGYFEREHIIRFDDLLARAKANDRDSIRILEKYGYFLGVGLKMIIYTLDPEIVVLGGPITEGFEYFKDSMMLQVKSLIFKRTSEKIVIDVANDPNMAVLGAAALYLDAHYSNDLVQMQKRQKKIESALQQTEKKYYKVFNNISDPVFIISNDTGRILDCNEKVVQRVYGFTIDELKMMTMADLQSPDDENEQDHKISPDSGAEKTFLHVTKTGERMHVEIHSDNLEFDGQETTLSVVRNVTERIEAERAANHRAAQAALTLKVSERINSALDPATVLSEIVNSVYDSFDFYGVMLLLMDKKKKNLVLNSISGGYKDIFPADLKIKVGEGMIGSAAKSREIQMSSDVTRDPNYVQKAGEVTQSELSVPIIDGREVIGVLDMQSDKLDSFQESDVSAAWTLSSLIATAIKNARLYQQAQEDLEERRKAEKEAALRASQAALVYEVGQRINSSLNLDTLLSEIVHSICDTFDYYGVMLFLMDEKKKYLLLKSIAGGYADIFPDDLSISVKLGMVGRAVRTKSIQISGDVSKNPDYIRKAGEKTKSELAVPIVHGRQVIGILDMQSDRLNAFSDADASVAWTLADQISTAIQNARHFATAQQEIVERKEAEKELRKNQNSLRKAKRESDSIFLNVEEGLFLINSKCKIASEYSKALEKILREDQPGGKSLLDILNGKLPPATHQDITEFLELMFEISVDEESLATLNPLAQIEVVFDEGEMSRSLAFKFRRILSKNKIVSLIATVNDVSEQVRLAEKLEESRSQSKQQMDWLLSILHVEPQLLKEFIDGVNLELTYIDSILKNNDLAAGYDNLLEKMYRSMHLIKGNASVLDLKFFVEKSHTFEEELTKIKKKKRVGGSDFVALVLQLGDIRKTIGELNNLITRISKIHSHFRPKRTYESEIFVNSIQNLINNIASDLHKKVTFDHKKFDAGSIPYQYRLTSRDIIIQLIRNSIYHGIESAEERKKMGKPATGNIILENVQDEHFVGFRLSDDGRGLLIDKLRCKAIESGRWQEAEILAWDDEQVASIIFNSGISTLEVANVVAGRGVGLDLVKNKLDRVKGRVDVSFEEGKSTEFTILFPGVKNKRMSHSELLAEAEVV